MTTRSRVFFGIIVLAVCFSSDAGSVSGATITKLQISKVFPDILFVQLDRVKDSTPACHINGAWTYAMSMTTESDKKMYALLLAARVSQAPVTISGTGTCDVFGSIESLSTAGL